MKKTPSNLPPWFTKTAAEKDLYIERMKARLASIAARRHFAVCRWSGDEPEPLFFPVTLQIHGENRRVWQMSARLYEIESDILSKPSADKQLWRATDVLTRATMRCTEGVLMDKINMEPVKEEEALEAFCHFVLPLAYRLRGALGAGKEEAEKMKQEALHWLASVIDNTFPHNLQLDIDEKRAVELIAIAHNLCQTLERIPQKKEVWDAAREIDPKTFTLGEDTERILLKKAGLDQLPKAPRGKNKS